MKLMAAENISCEENCGMGTVIYIAVDGKYAGSIVIADRIKPEAGEAILSLKESGVRKTVMLTEIKKMWVFLWPENWELTVFMPIFFRGIR